MRWIMLLMLLLVGTVSAQDATVVTIDDEIEVEGPTFTERAIMETVMARYVINAQINRIMLVLGTDSPNDAATIALQSDPSLSDTLAQLEEIPPLAQETVFGLVEGVVLRRTAAEHEISIEDGDGETALLQTLNLNRDDITPEQRESTIAAFREDALDAGVSAAVFDAYLEELALREALAPVVTVIGPTEIHADSRHILVETEAEAEEIIDLLAAGESFAELAETRSIDPGTAINGGELGMAAVRLYVTPFADALREAPLNEIVGPVESEFGFHIIEVTAREEVEIEADTLARLQREAMVEWLDETVKAVDFTVDDSLLDWVPEPTGIEYIPLPPIQP